MKEFLGFLKFAGGIVFAMAILTFLVSAATYGVESYKCEKYSEVTGLTTSLILFDACYVKSGDQWTTKDQHLSMLER